MATPLERRPFTVAEYERMASTGVLAADERLELIRGEIVTMSPIGPRHAGQVNRLARLLNRRVGDLALIAVQNPVRLDDFSEPQPDIAVLHPRADDYGRAHPLPGDVLLLIEVADSTLVTDRSVKLRLYAEAGIPETWLIDLDGEAIERHSEPLEGRYRQVRRARRGERLASVVLPELVLTVDEVLG